MDDSKVLDDQLELLRLQRWLEFNCPGLIEANPSKSHAELVVELLDQWKPDTINWED